MQQLSTSNLSVNIGEAMEARTKDPLWFLARQWQSGEFAAENGGRPAYVAFSWQDFPLTSATIGSGVHTLNLDQPLESLVEREDAAGDAPGWQAAALEYTFAAETEAQTFVAAEYGGRRLDWYHFDVSGQTNPTAPAVQNRRMTPTQLYVRGAPHPRWWRFEDADATFDGARDPEPNVLSMLLPEFFYLDVNNWYIAPLPGRAGTVREMTDLIVVDSFEIVTHLTPVVRADTDDWRIFTLEHIDSQAATGLDGRHLFMPNVALEVLHNDDLEDVRFLRDEEANLVWACEHRYRLADGTPVVNGETPAPAGDAGNQATGDNLPRFVLKSETERHWIPYVPRQSSAQGAVNGEVYLRRARTVESASLASPQYGSRIVGESWRINEEEVPRSGLRVRRIARFARGSDGAAYFWVGRQKETGRNMVHPDLRFDYLEPSAATDT